MLCGSRGVVWDGIRERVVRETGRRWAQFEETTVCFGGGNSDGVPA